MALQNIDERVILKVDVSPSGASGSSGSTGNETGTQGGNLKNQGDMPNANRWPMPSQYSKVDPNSIQDANEMRDRLRGTYGENEQNTLVNRLENRGAQYRDDARSSEQQKGNYASQFDNLAQNNPRGNLNQASYDATLRFSRLADKVNNRLHWDPGTISIGTGKRGVLQSGTGPTVSRWDPIETEEMRQMAANRRLDERARNAGVDLQSRIQAYPQDLQEMRDKAALGLEGDLLRSEDSFNRTWQTAVLQSEYVGSVENYFKKNMQRYILDLDLANKTRIADYLLNELTPWAAQWMAQYLAPGVAVPPGMANRFNAEIKDKLWGLVGTTINGQTVTAQDVAAAWPAVQATFWSGGLPYHAQAFAGAAKQLTSGVPQQQDLTRTWMERRTGN